MRGPASEGTSFAFTFKSYVYQSPTSMIIIPIRAAYGRSYTH